MIKAVVAVLVILGLGACNDDPAALTVVGYNARHSDLDEGAFSWEARRDVALEVLTALDADLIGLQEAAEDQRRDLEALGLDCIECGGDFSNHNAILYRADRLEARISGTFWLSDTPEVPESTSWGNELPRWVTWTEVQPRGKPSSTRFLVYNTHLDHQSQPSRMESLHAIMAHAREHARGETGTLPIILMGDLNAKPDWPELDFLLNAHPEYPHLPLRDVLAREGADDDADGTYHGFDGTPDLDRIDYILVSEGIGSRRGAIITEEGTDGTPPSDHFPVCAEIVLSE